MQRNRHRRSDENQGDRQQCHCHKIFRGKAPQLLRITPTDMDYLRVAAVPGCPLLALPHPAVHCALVTAQERPGLREDRGHVFRVWVPSTHIKRAFISSILCSPQQLWRGLTSASSTTLSVSHFLCCVHDTNASLLSCGCPQSHLKSTPCREVRMPSTACYLGTLVTKDCPLKLAMCSFV